MAPEACWHTCPKKKGYSREKKEQLIIDYENNAGPTSGYASLVELRQDLKYLYLRLTSSTRPISSKQLDDILDLLTTDTNACKDGFHIRVSSARQLINPNNSIDALLSTWRQNLVDQVIDRFILERRSHLSRPIQIHIKNQAYEVARRNGFGVPALNPSDPHAKDYKLTLLPLISDLFEHEYTAHRMIEVLSASILEHLSTTQQIGSRTFFGYAGEYKEGIIGEEPVRWNDYLFTLLFPYLPSQIELVLKMSTEDTNEFGDGNVIDINWPIVHNAMLTKLIREKYFTLDSTECNALLWVLNEEFSDCSDLSSLFKKDGFINTPNELCIILKGVNPKRQDKWLPLINAYISYNEDNYSNVHRGLYCQQLAEILICCHNNPFLSDIKSNLFELLERLLTELDISIFLADQTNATSLFNQLNKIYTNTVCPLYYRLDTAGNTLLMACLAHDMADCATMIIAGMSHHDLNQQLLARNHNNDTPLILASGSEKSTALVLKVMQQLPQDEQKSLLTWRNKENHDAWYYAAGEAKLPLLNAYLDLTGVLPSIQETAHNNPSDLIGILPVLLNKEEDITHWIRHSLYNKTLNTALLHGLADIANLAIPDIQKSNLHDFIRKELFIRKTELQLLVHDILQTKDETILLEVLTDMELFFNYEQDKIEVLNSLIVPLGNSLAPTHTKVVLKLLSLLSQLHPDFIYQFAQAITPDCLNAFLNNIATEESMINLFERVLRSKTEYAGELLARPDRRGINALMAGVRHTQLITLLRHLPRPAKMSILEATDDEGNNAFMRTIALPGTQNLIQIIEIINDLNEETQANIMSQANRQGHPIQWAKLQYLPIIIGAMESLPEDKKPTYEPLAIIVNHQLDNINDLFPFLRVLNNTETKLSWIDAFFTHHSGEQLLESLSELVISYEPHDSELLRRIPLFLTKHPSLCDTLRQEIEHHLTRGPIFDAKLVCALCLLPYDLKKYFFTSVTEQGRGILHRMIVFNSQQRNSNRTDYYLIPPVLTVLDTLNSEDILAILMMPCQESGSNVLLYSLIAFPQITMSFLQLIQEKLSSEQQSELLLHRNYLFQSAFSYGYCSPNVAIYRTTRHIMENTSSQKHSLQAMLTLLPPYKIYVSTSNIVLTRISITAAQMVMRRQLTALKEKLHALAYDIDMRSINLLPYPQAEVVHDREEPKYLPLKALYCYLGDALAEAIAANQTAQASERFQACLELWQEHINAALHNETLMQHRGLKDIFCKSMAFLGTLSVISWRGRFFSQRLTKTHTQTILETIQEATIAQSSPALFTHAREPLEDESSEDIRALLY